MEVSRGSGVWAALCIRRTLCRHVTICTTTVIFLLFDCLLAVFDEWYTVLIVKNTQNHWCTNRHRSTKTVPTVYQNVPIVKNSQNQLKDSQNSKNDHWCTNRHMSIKTVSTVYQSSKTVKRQSKQQKWPLVYQSSHVYQDCTNSVPIVKNSEKQSKDSQNSKNDHWCTSRHNVYQDCTNSVPTIIPIVKKSQK